MVEHTRTEPSQGDTMKLRGIDFGPVAGASGVQGFFGERHFPEYRHHQMLKFVPGFNFDGMTFTAKTATLEKNNGNMPLRDDGIRVKEWSPKCISCSMRDIVAGQVVNAVGLSNPGILALLNEERWQQRTAPFYLSFMPLGDASTWANQCRHFVDILKPQLSAFQSRIALQVNFSCPNVGVEHDGSFVATVHACFDILAELDIPIEVKLNVLESIETAQAITAHATCDALCMSNAIPFGKLPSRIDWNLMYPKGSPVAKKLKNEKAQGALSGAPLLDLVVEWVRRAKMPGGLEKPIRAGGGILSQDDVDRLWTVGADGVFLGTIAITRPWRLQSTIKAAHKIFKRPRRTRV